MKDNYEKLIELLKKDDRLLSSEDTILKNEVINLSNHMDAQLLKLLLKDENVKNMFFAEIDGNYVFDKQKFNWVINSKEFLPDSYTSYSQNIGLIDSNGNFLKKVDDVVLSFPNKDCFLEFDSTQEAENRKEVFFNETLSKSDIDILKDNKVFTNVKKNDKSGSKKIDTFDKDDNLLIKGNNLLTMYSLLPRYKNQVKCMYWDILYNTNSDIVPYNDSFKHSSWLVMMKNRLEIAFQLLKNEGSIFIHCDYNEMAYLKVLCDEVFGRNNYVTMITCKVKSSGGLTANDSMIFDCSEYILVYAKNYSLLEYNDYFVPTELIDKNCKTVSNYKQIIYDIDYSKKEFIDEIKGIKYYRIPKGNFKIENLDINNMEPKDFYEHRNEIFRLTALSGGIGKKLKESTKDFMNNDDLFMYEYVPTRGRDKGKLSQYFLHKGNRVTYLNNYLEVDDKNKTITKIEGISNILTGDLWQGISSEGGVTLNNGKKPERLMKLIIQIATNPGDLVLDAYMGSGTTPAVALKLGRKFIGIEQLNSHYNMALKRLNDVVLGDRTGISKDQDVDWNGGESFVSLELAKVNMNYIEKIQEASDDSLEDIYNELINNKFLNYRVDINAMQDNEDEFKTLSVDEQRNLLMEILDKNMLYVNYSDIEDETFEISEDDKKFNDSFYEK